MKMLHSCLMGNTETLLLNMIYSYKFKNFVSNFVIEVKY